MTLGAVIFNRIGLILRIATPLIIICASVLGLTGCMSDGGIGNPIEVDHPSELHPGVSKPTLRTGVKVRIAVTASGEPIMEETLKEVSAQGEIAMPYIGIIQQCHKMSLEEFQTKLTEEYKKFYVDPIVTAYYVPMTEGGSSPWGTVLVLGAVQAPGQVHIPITCDLTLTRAIQEVGGIGMYADASKVRLTRTGLDKTQQMCTIDTEKIGEQGRVDLDALLMPGDVIFVPNSNW